MAKQISKTTIGAFVVGAVALAVVAVMIFGTGRFLKDRVTFVLCFEGSVQGLREGAAVVMNGVKVGEVTEIRLVGDAANLKFYVPVFIEIDRDKIELRRPDTQRPAPSLFAKKGSSDRPLLEKGLKGVLVQQSYVTGLLMVSLVFLPDKPAQLVGLVPDVPEIPTVRAGFAELEATVNELPLKEMADKLDHILTGLDSLANSTELRDSLLSLNKTLKHVDGLVTHVDGQVTPLSAEIRRNLQETLATARKALDESRKALVAMQGLAAQSVFLGSEAGRTMKEVTNMSRSVQNAMDYLERHPESVIRGKGSAQGDGH